MNTVLRPKEATALLPPLILKLASDLSVRALAIKGATLAKQGLRKERPSADVDILVEPARFEEFLRHLQEFGWIDRDEQVLFPLADEPTVLAAHSITLLHERWPVSLDLHRYFPGFLRSPFPVFDELWRDRELSEIGGVECGVPSRADHWLLATLHVLRSHSGAERLQLIDAARNSGEEFCARLALRAAELGAAYPVAEVFSKIGIPSPTGPRPEPYLRQWDMVVAGDRRFHLAVVEEFQRARGLHRLAVLRRALFPPEQTLRIFDDVGPGTWGLWKARTKRLGRGLGRIPSALRSLRASRRRDNDRAN